MIDARRIASWVTVGPLNDFENQQHGKPGDWQITEPNGKVYFMNDEKFRREFCVLSCEVARRYKFPKEKQPDYCSPDFEKRVLEVIRDVLREAL